MKRVAWWAAGGLLLMAATGWAQSPPPEVLAHASSVPPPPGSALPPPGLNDPGEKPQSVPLPDTGIRPSVAPAAREQDGHGDSTNVSVRTDANGDRVEEYRRGGVVEMVRVTPRNGVTQTYRRSSTDGSLVRDPRQGPVSPVYYDVYKWGGPGKPVSGATAPPAQLPAAPPASGSH